MTINTRHSSKHAKRSAASTQEHSAPPSASYVPEGGTGDNTARAQASCTTHSTHGFMRVSARRRGSEWARGPRTYLARMLGCRSVPRSRRSHRRSSRRRLSKSAAPTSGRQRSSAPASVFGCLWSRGQLLGCATEARSPHEDYLDKPLVILDKEGPAQPHHAPRALVQPREG